MSRRESDREVLEWLANGFPIRTRWAIAILIALALVGFFLGDYLERGGK